MAIKFLSGLNLSNITAGSILKLDSNGNIVAATAGTDYATSANAVWSTSGSNPTTAYYTGNVRVGTYQASVEASARLHVFDYQTTTPKLLIEDGNTGDASMEFKISTQSYVMGIDNSDNDLFKISGTAFGTNDIVKISNTGAFDVYGQNATFYSGTANNSLKVGRNGNEYLQMYVADRYSGLIYTQDEITGNHEFYFSIHSSTVDEKFFTWNRHNADGSGGGEWMRLTEGKLGIGTTSPSYKLQVDVNSASTGTDSITVANRGVTSNGHTVGIRFRYNTAEPAAIRSVLTNYVNGASRLGFFTSSDGSGANIAERMGITADGNVGIGTTSPDSKLHVLSTGDNGSAGLQDYGFVVTSSSTDQPTLGAESTGDGYANLNLGSNISGTRRFWHISKRKSADSHKLSFYYYNGSGFDEKFQFRTDGSFFAYHLDLPSGGQLDWANGDARIVEGLVSNYSLSFQTYTGSALTTKMFIDSSGNVTLNSYGAGLLKTNASGVVSLDTNTYLTTSSASSTYLPLTGGTVANGNTAIPLTISRTSATTMQVGVRFYAEDGVNDPTDMYFGAGTDSEPYWATSANLSAGNMIWHEGNDGTGSGLDADLLDGNHASAFALAAHNHDSDYVKLSGSTMTGALTFNSNGNNIIIPHGGNNTGNIIFKQDGVTYNDIDFSAYFGMIGFYNVGNSSFRWRFGVNGGDADKLIHAGFGGTLIDANGDYNGTWQSYSPSSFAAASHTHSGADITSGTISTARLDTNVVRTDTTQTIDGSKTFGGDKFLKTNKRVSGSQYYPLGHYTPGETVFEIDPTWTQNELRAFFNSNSVSWVADSTAPGGYCIYIDGGVYVGADYNSGFPYIPVDTDDIFYMECWIKNEGTNQGHYMGSIDRNESFNAPASGSGNPGSYGYWVMSGYTSANSWTKVSGYISGFSATETGKFETGTKYWTPQALFNYNAGTGTRACRISGWKAIKVNHVGNRTFAGDVVVSGGLKIGTNNVATESYVSSALSNYSTTNHTHDASDVVSGQFDAARIPDLSGTYSVSSHTHSEYAPLASPSLTGTPTAPTASAGTNTTQIATTAFVSTAVSNLVDSAPGTLNTLNELAAALGDDANFSTTITNSIATKLSLTGGTVTGATTFDSLVTFKGHIKLYDGAYTGDWGGIESKQRSANSHDMIVYVADDGGSGDRIKLVSRHYSAGDTDLAIFDATFAEINTRLKLNTVDANTTSTTALVLNGAEIEKRTLGTAAFEATTQFAAAAHAHDASDISSGQLDAARIPDLSSTYALTDHTHSYLPLSGGTLTGQLALSNATASTGLYITSNTASGSGSVLRLNKSAADKQIYQSFESDTLYLGVAASQTTVADVGTKGSVSLDLKTNYTTRMRIDSSGNVGIGTTSPSKKLVVNGETWINQTSDYFGAGTTVQIGAGGTGSVGIRSNILYLYPYSANSASSLIYGYNGNGSWNLNNAGGNDRFDFYSYGGSTTVLSLKSSGNVGIGTTSPVAELHVNGSGNTGYLHLTNSTSGSTINDGMTVGVNASNYFVFVREAAPLYFGTDATERMRITSTGNVGIGTTSPNTFLHVAGQGNRAGGNIHLGNENDGAGKYGYITSAHYNAATEPEGYSLIGGYSDASSNQIHIGGMIYESNPATQISFWTHTATTHSTGGSERMRITSEGYVGIGTTSPSYKLDVNGSARLNSGAVFGDRITVSGNVENDEDKVYDLGTDASRWRVVYCETLDSAGQHETNLANDDIQHLPTGTVLVWENGKAVPCRKFADHMKIGVAVFSHKSPVVQGAEPVLCAGEVQEGDYLVTSDKKGHAVALKRSEVMERNLFDCVIGKALEYGSGDSHSIKTWINI